MKTQTVLTQTQKEPRWHMEIPARILADIEIMFEESNKENIRALTEFKSTLLSEEMYIMLKQLHELEEVYGIDIPTKPPVIA